MTRRMILAVFGSLFVIGSASAQTGGFIGFNCGHHGFGTPAFAPVGGMGFSPVFTPVVGTTVFTPVVAVPTPGTTNGTGFTPVIGTTGPVTADAPMFVLQFKPPVLPGTQPPKDPVPPVPPTGLAEINETLKRIEGHLRTIAEKKGGGEEAANTAAARRALGEPKPETDKRGKKEAAAAPLADRFKEADRVIAAIAPRK
jgi:hypothetical protein